MLILIKKDDAQTQPMPWIIFFLKWVLSSKVDLCCRQTSTQPVDPKKLHGVAETFPFGHFSSSFITKIQNQIESKFVSILRKLAQNKRPKIGFKRKIAVLY